MHRFRKILTVVTASEFIPRNCKSLAPRHFVYSALTSCHQCRWYMKIYTKTGDKGTSALFTGERRSKDDAIFHGLGAADELSSAIGLTSEFSKDAGLPYAEMLLKVQCMLQDAASSIATPQSTARAAHLKRVHLDRAYVPLLEQWIDEMTVELPALKNFIIPSGGKTAASLHLARAICRRAERCIIPLTKDGTIDDETLKFLNRLSDLLFTTARHAALMEGKEETIYRRPVEKKDP